MSSYEEKRNFILKPSYIWQQKYEIKCLQADAVCRLVDCDYAEIELILFVMFGKFDSVDNA